MRRVVTRVVLGFIVIFVAALVGLFISEVIHGPFVHELAPQFRGWVVIQFDDGRCQPLQRFGTFPSEGISISIPPSGCGCTSNSEPHEFRFYRYEYVFSDGHREPLATSREVPPGAVPNIFIWHDQGGAGVGTTKSGHKTLPQKVFFVGTREDYAALGRGDFNDPFKTSYETQCPDLNSQRKVSRPAVQRTVS